MERRYTLPSNTRTDANGFNLMARAFAETRELKSGKVIIDFKNVTWFEANLCAMLGAILSGLSRNGVEIEFTACNKRVEDILLRNHFFHYFKGNRRIDIKQSTIKFRRFENHQGRDFVEYLDNELLSQPGLPNMSELLKKKINKSIFEIYENAITHGKSQEVFTCGQYYPQKKKLDFTIADLGTTIRKNVNNYLDESRSGVETIEWAVEKGNTTKKGSIPGGLGLSLIREFLLLNKGKIQIVSSDGFWQEKKGNIFAEELKYAFVGTVVNLEFDLADTSSYVLSSEITPDNIF